MDYDIGIISVRDIHAVEETIRYLEINNNPTYDDLIHYLSWYFDRDPKTYRFKPGQKPKSWMLEWIKVLSS